MKFENAKYYVNFAGICANLILAAVNIFITENTPLAVFNLLIASLFATSTLILALADAATRKRW